MLKTGLSSRERLILAATRQVIEGNLATVTARSICKEANVTAPTLYHFFADLPDLYCVVLERIYERGLVEHPDEQSDPAGVLDFAWTTQLKTALEQPGVIDLLNNLLSTGRVPEVLQRTFDRLERAFSVIAADRPLRVAPRLAAEIFWAAGLGMATLMAAGQHGVAIGGDGAEILREAVLARIFQP